MIVIRIALINDFTMVLATYMFDTMVYIFVVNVLIFMNRVVRLIVVVMLLLVVLGACEGGKSQRDLKCSHNHLIIIEIFIIIN